MKSSNICCSLLENGLFVSVYLPSRVLFPLKKIHKGVQRGAEFVDNYHFSP